MVEPLIHVFTPPVKTETPHFPFCSQPTQNTPLCGVSGRSPAYSMGVTFFDLRRTGNLNLFFFFFPTSADHGYRGKLSQAYHTHHIRLVTKELYSHINLPTSQVPAYAPGATHLIHVPRKNVKPRLIFRNRPLKKSSLSILSFSHTR